MFNSNSYDTVTTVADRLKKYKDMRAISLARSIVDCESPIEQLLSIELSYANLELMSTYNPFVKTILINKQTEIVTREGKKYRIDFEIIVTDINGKVHKFAIECDSYEYHQDKKTFEYDYIRTRDLQVEGYNVLKFTGTELLGKTSQCVRDIIKFILTKIEKSNEGY